MPDARQTISVVMKCGMGNRLFQLAAAVYASVHTGRELITLPSQLLPSHHEGSDMRSHMWMTRNIRNLTSDEEATLFKCVTTTRVSPRLTIAGMLEDLHAVQNIQHITMEGFWIAAAFAEDTVCEKVLRSILVVDETCLPLTKILHVPPRHDKSVAVHVRRGDYMENVFRWLYIDLTTTGVDGGCYYTRAMNHFSEDTHFLIFSDDPVWCAQQSIFNGARMIIMPHTLSTLETFGLMSRCECGIICPNSTFSWWAAYLNPSARKIVCFPDRWTASDPQNVSGIKDVHPTGCVRVSIECQTAINT